MLKKLTLTMAFCLTIINMKANGKVFNEEEVLQADTAFTQNDLRTLENLSSSNPQNTLYGYMYAKSSILNQSRDDIALKYVENTSNSFMRNDVLHQLLAFNFAHNDYDKYIVNFNLLSSQYLTQNEKCALELSYYQINSQVPDENTNNLTQIASNTPTPNCAKLIAYKYSRKELNSRTFHLMINNLAVSNREEIIKDINSITKIYDTNMEHKIRTINKIVATAKADPNLALKELAATNLNKDDVIFVTNYIALKFALRQNFTKAIQLFEKNGNTMLSNEQQEWLVRSYMSNNEWHKVIKYINLMPQNLKSSNQWLYWKAYANLKLGNTNLANKIMHEIPNDYSYYSMLAGNHLGNSLQFKSQLPKNVELPTSIKGEASWIIELAQIARKHNRQSLLTIANVEWSYLAKQSNEEELLTLSLMAKKAQLYDLSIAAADLMHTRYIELSYPIAFDKEYNRFSQEAGIKPSYSLAVTRQESRFNPNALSYVGAAGLMQIMPATFKEIGQKLNSSSCSSDKLQCNIQFGTWYLANLYNKFNSYIFATAAYNAGGTHVKAWQANLSKLSNNLQIELIPFNETRTYVQKVLSNLVVYEKELYGFENAHNKTSEIAYLE